MELTLNKEVFIEEIDELLEVNSLLKKLLHSSLELNLNSIDFAENPSGKLTLYTQEQEDFLLEITYRLAKLADRLERCLN